MILPFLTSKGGSHLIFLLCLLTTPMNYLSILNYPEQLLFLVNYPVCFSPTPLILFPLTDWIELGLFSSLLPLSFLYLSWFW